jgi:hypothetical protein
MVVDRECASQVVAAIKAHLRHQEETARQLLLRAYQRVGMSGAPDDVAAMVFQLTATIPPVDPTTTDFADQITDLAKEVWPA